MTCYWLQDDFVVHAYPGREPVALHPSAAEILGTFGDWNTPEQAAAVLPHLLPDADRILLPRAPAPSPRVPLEQALYARRTHRSFTERPVALGDLAALLHTVFGPAGFLDGLEYGALVRRTSPAGGARQELDAYLVAPNVAGIPPGVFHYNSREHSLELLGEGVTHGETARLCAHQEGTDQAAFVVFVVADWGRLRVKYRHPRAYRVSLLNAGQDDTAGPDAFRRPAEQACGDR
ncbi:SagB/ThcOx family dehydrogenase [Streptomyces sp. NPDC048357]|uniref:SagB/ThcOx family dehydrogenase n=1 Tax=Streptomyces sp. NPDC048357 TaxID=3154719 RepID=UPI00342EF5F5